MRGPGGDGVVRACLPDSKLEALRLFTLAMLEQRGAVSDDDKDALFSAGYPR
jgi:hypothetical protein